MWIKTKPIYLFFSMVFILTFFTCIRLIVKYYYYLQNTQGNYNLTMLLIDKAHMINLPSYVTGWLHGCVVLIMIAIILNK